MGLKSLSVRPTGGHFQQGDTYGEYVCGSEPQESSRGRDEYTGVQGPQARLVGRDA